MKPETAVEKTPETKPEVAPMSSIFVETEKLFEEMEKIYKTISERAFELFHFRGREWGKEWTDWFKAESEILKHVPTEISEAEGMLKVKLEVPGFKAENLKVSVEPTRLIVNGRYEAKEEKKEGEEVIYTERRTNQILRDLALPCEVNPEKASAILKDGILTLTIPKAVEPTKVEVKNE